MNEKRKQLTFDIDTNIAKEILGEKNYTTAYANIKDFMKNEGWIHIEGSVYMSEEPLSATNVAYVIDELKLKYPYLTKCIKAMHQSDISNIHSLSHLFEYDGTAGKFAQKGHGDRAEPDSTLPISPNKFVSDQGNRTSQSLEQLSSIADRHVQKKADVPQRENKKTSLADAIAKKKAVVSQREDTKQSQNKHKSIGRDL